MNLQDIQSTLTLTKFIDDWNKEAILANPNKYIKASVEWDNDYNTFNTPILKCVIHSVDLNFGYSTRHIAMRYTVAGKRSNSIAEFPSWCSFIKVDHNPVSLYNFFVRLQSEINKIRMA